MNTLAVQKKVLRKQIGAQLSQLSQASIRDQSRAIRDRIISLPSFEECRSISCYLSMPSGEVNTNDLVGTILQSGKDLYVPKILSKEGNMDFLRVYSADDLNLFPSGTWGIKEPQDTYESQARERVLGSPLETRLDIILLPGIAFDRGLSRLGHGKGYYDRFISAYTSSRPKPLLIGLGLREQLLDAGEVPVGDNDWQLDMIIAPEETISRTN